MPELVKTMATEAVAEHTPEEMTSVPSVFGVPVSWQHGYHFSFENTEPL